MSNFIYGTQILQRRITSIYEVLRDSQEKDASDSRTVMISLYLWLLCIELSLTSANRLVYLPSYCAKGQRMLKQQNV